MMTQPIMKKAKGDGVAIQLAVWEGSGRNILCIHGITSNCRCWDVLASALSPKQRVLAMDLRGRGGSDKPESGYSLEHHIEDIRSLLDDLGLKDVVLMGHSLGAFISLAFGAKYPGRVNRIILVDGGGALSKEQIDKVFQGIKPALDRLGKVFPSSEAYLGIMKQAPYIQPWSSAMETYYRYELETADGGVRVNIRPEHIQEEAQNMRKVATDSFYPLITCKTLILRATKGLLSQDDILLPEPVVTRMLEEIPKAKRLDVVGSNHYGIVFQPNDVRDRAIQAFLDEP
jgi:pimeloyl-ACP methyl ester carboxylesterase